MRVDVRHSVFIRTKHLHVMAWLRYWEDRCSHAYAYARRKRASAWRFGVGLGSELKGISVGQTASPVTLTANSVYEIIVCLCDLHPVE